MLELCHMCVFLRQICDLKDVAEKVISCSASSPRPHLLFFPRASYFYIVLLVRWCNGSKMLEITFLCVKYS